MDHEDPLFLMWLLLALLSAYNSCRSRTMLTRSGILLPVQSPWHHLYANGDATTFLKLTGLTRPVFHQLVGLVFSQNRARIGRHQDLNEAAQVRLFLFYISSRMGVNHLCLLFGVTPSSCSRYLSIVLKLIVRNLRRHQAAKIQFPSEQKLEEFEQLITAREPLASGIVGFADGLALPIECSHEERVQNTFYNG